MALIQSATHANPAREPDIPTHGEEQISIGTSGRTARRRKAVAQLGRDLARRRSLCRRVIGDRFQSDEQSDGRLG